MTVHDAASARSAPRDIAPTDRSGLLLCLMLTLVFAPVVCAHAAFLFADEPAVAAPARTAVAAPR